MPCYGAMGQGKKRLGRSTGIPAPNLEDPDKKETEFASGWRTEGSMKRRRGEVSPQSRSAIRKESRKKRRYYYKGMEEV